MFDFFFFFLVILGIEFRTSFWCTAVSCISFLLFLFYMLPHQHISVLVALWQVEVRKPLSPKHLWLLPVPLPHPSHWTEEQSHHECDRENPEGHRPCLHLIPSSAVSCPSSCAREEWGGIRWGWGVSLGNILPRLTKAEEWTGPSQKVEMALCFWFLSCISCEFMVQLFAILCVVSLWPIV